MKARMMVVVLLLMTAVAGAQERYTLGQLPSTGGTFAIPNGTSTLKGFHFQGYPALGIYSPSGGVLYIGGTSGGLTFNDTAVSFVTALVIGPFQLAATAGGTADLIMGREAAATLQLGADAATATAQVIKGPDSTTADTAGANLSLRGGAGTTGNANGGNLILRGGAKAGTGEPGGVVVIDDGTKPTCAAANRGMLWYDQGGAGVADTFEICAKAAAGDVYAWRVAATIP